MELKVKSPANLNNLLDKCRKRNSCIIESALNQSVMYITGKLLKKTVESRRSHPFIQPARRIHYLHVNCLYPKEKENFSYLYDKHEVTIGARHLGPRDKVPSSLMLTFQRDGPQSPPNRQSWDVKLVGDLLNFLEDLCTCQKQKNDLNYMFRKGNVVRKGRRGVLSFFASEKKILIFFKIYIYPYKQHGLQEYHWTMEYGLEFVYQALLCGTFQTFIK